MTPAAYLRSLGYRLYRMPTGCYDVWVGQGIEARMRGNWSEDDVAAEAKMLMEAGENG